MTFASEGIPFLRAEHVQGGAIDPSTVNSYISLETHRSLSRSQLLPGDLLVTIAGTLGRVGYVPLDSSAMNCNQAVAFVRLKSNVADPEYVALACQSEAVIGPLVSLRAGGGVQNLNLEQVRRLRVPLPPLSEQRKVKRQLGQQLREAGRARAAAEAQLEASDELLRSELRCAFESTEGQAGKDACLGDVLRLRPDIIHPYNNPSGRAIFVGLEHIESHTGVLIGSSQLEMSELTGRKPQFRKGQIVYGYLRPYLNKVWIAEFDGLCSVDQYVYDVDESVADTEFVAWFMRSPVYLKRAPVAGSPGQLPRIRIEEVNAVQLRLPPLETQRQIAARLRAFASNTRMVIGTIHQQLTALDSYFTALLRGAFRGEQ
jgi:hypothetical protein